MIINYNLVKLLKVLNEFQLYAKETYSLYTFGKTEISISNLIFDEILITIDDIKTEPINSLFKNKQCYDYCLRVPVHNNIDYIKPFNLYIGVSQNGIHFCFEYNEINTISSIKFLEIFNTNVYLYPFFGDVLNAYESINSLILAKIGHIEHDTFLIKSQEMLNTFKYNIDYKYDTDELARQYNFNNQCYPFIINVKSINNDDNHELDLTIIQPDVIDKINKNLSNDDNQ